jgi:hypothetical protein
MGITNGIFIFFVVILIGVAMYYLYKWLMGGSDLQSVIVFNPKKRGMPGNSSNVKTFNEVSLPPLYAGGEFSVSTWIYINDWNINKGSNKPFLTLSGGSDRAGYNTMVLYLGQNVNKLSVRVSSATVGTGDDAGIQMNSAEMTQLTSKGAGGKFSDTTDGFKRCDIEEIDLQRWVCINVVLNGRTTDVYIDGKLSRSCVLNSMYGVTGDQTTVKLGGPDGFGGYIGQTQIANYAYSPDQVYKMYQNGPTDQSLWTLISGMFSLTTFTDVPETAQAKIVTAPTEDY